MDHLSNFKNQLNSFAKRARYRRAIRWSLIGIGIYASILIFVTVAQLIQQKMLVIGALEIAIAGFVVLGLGFCAGWWWKVDELKIAREIDTSTGSKDRFLTSLTLDKSHPMHKSVVNDSSETLHKYDPKNVFIVRNSKLTWATATLVCLSAGLQFINIRGVLLSPKAKAEIAEVKKLGSAVEKLTLEKLRASGQIPQAVQAQSAQQLKLARDLKSGSKSKEEAMRDADRIASESIKQEKQTFASAEQKVDTARSALERVAERRAIEEAKNWMKMDNNSKSQQQANQNSNNQQQSKSSQSKGNQAGTQQDSKGQNSTPKPEKIPISGQQDQSQSGSIRDLEKASQEAQSKVDQLQKQMDSGKQENGEPMTSEQKEALQKEIDQAKQQAEQALKLSQQAKDFLKRLQNDPDMQKLMQQMQKLQQEAQRRQNGEAPQLSKEELEQIQKQLEELAKKYKDEKSLKELIEQMKKAAEQMKQGNLSAEMRQMMQQGMGQSSQGSQNSGSEGNQLGGNSLQQNGKGENGKGDDGSLNKNGQGKGSSDNKDPNAKATPTKVKSQRRQGKNEEYYQEFFGPSLTGDRGKMPYAKQLPNYTRQAESALENKKISARHRRRVKNYFDTLSGRSAPQKSPAKPSTKP